MRDANYEIETDYMNRMYFAYGYLPYQESEGHLEQFDLIVNSTSLEVQIGD